MTGNTKQFLEKTSAAAYSASTSVASTPFTTSTSTATTNSTHAFGWAVKSSTA